jgi:hypothetical protein
MNENFNARKFDKKELFAEELKLAEPQLPFSETKSKKISPRFWKSQESQLEAYIKTLDEQSKLQKQENRLLQGENMMLRKTHENLKRNYHDLEEKFIETF